MALTAPAANLDREFANGEGPRQAPARPQIIKAGTVGLDVVEGRHFV